MRTGPRPAPSRPRRRRGFATALLAGTAAILAYGCVDKQIVAVTLGSVTVSPDAVPNLRVGTSISLSALVRDDGGTVLSRAGVTWASLDSTVASIDTTGLATGNARVIGMATGTTSIVVSFRELADTATVNVDPAPQITLTPDSAFLNGEAGGAPPAPDTIRITRGAATAANLEGLAVSRIDYPGAAQGWLVAALDTTTSPTNLVLTANTAGIPFGRYPATVEITATNDLLESGGVEVPVVLSLAGVTVSDGTALVDEGGGSDTITVRLDAQPDTTVVFGISVDLPGEVSFAPDTLVFEPGNWDTAQPVVLTGVNDLVRDGDRQAVVTISVDPARSDDRFDPVSPREVLVTNTDDDLGTFQIEVSGGSTQVGENGTTDDFTVVLDAQPLDTVVFRVTRGDTTEVALSPSVLTFAPAAWNTPQTVTVQGVDDDVLDGVQQSWVYVTVDSARSDPAFIAFGSDSLQVATSDDDVAGFLIATTTPRAAGDSATTVSEAAIPDTVMVTLGAEPASDVVFSLVSSDVGEVTIAPATLTFGPADWNVAQPVVVSGVDDQLLDGPQVSTITVSVVAAQSDDAFDALPPSVFEVLTLDDDVPGLTIVESGAGTVTIEPGGQDQFTVALGAQPAGAVVVDLVSTDPTEVTISPTRLTFPAVDWNVPQTITATGVDEDFDDGDRAVPVVLTIDTAATHPDYDLLPPDTVVVTNTDDDTAGFTLTQTAGGTLVTEAGSQDTIRIVLDARPIDTVVVTLLSSDTTEVEVGPALLSFDTDDWNVAQDIVVTGVDDGEPDGNRFSLIAVGVSGALSDAAFANVADQTVQVTTINDDTVSVRISPTSGLQTDENGGTASFTVVLGSRPSADVLIDMVSSLPTEGSVAPALLTFTAGDWDQPRTVTVTGVDDAVDDGNRPYTIQIGASSGDAAYDALDPTDVSVSNIDNDDAPVLSVGSQTVTEGDAGTVAAVFTVTQSIASTQNVQVNWTAVNGSATAPADYVAASGTLTFPAGGPLTQTFTVLVNGDLLDEGASETFSVVLSGAVNATTSGVNGTGTIVDDDGPPTFSIDDVAVLEGDAGTVIATFTVSQSAASGLSTSVNWATADGTATLAGNDYVAGGGTLTFVPGGPLTQTVTVTVNGDLLDEGAAENFLVQLSGATNASILDPSGTGTITDDDDPPTLSVNDVTVTEGSGGTTTASFTVTLSEPSGLFVSANFATADVTATAGSDYTATSGTVTFAPGSPLTQTVNVGIVPDLLDDGDSETFTLNLTGPSNATIADGTGLGTITDDDDPPALSIGDVTIAEGNSGTTAAVFTVTLSAASAQTVGVSWTTGDGTATTLGSDYVAGSGVLTFVPGGSLTQTVSVQVIGDLTDEGASESFVVTLSAPGNATILDATGVGTITDDDDPPSLSIGDVTVAEGDAGSANALLVVTLSRASGLAISVDFTTVDGTATTPADYTATTGTLTFAAGGQLQDTILVQIQGDVLDEGLSEALTVVLSNPTNASIVDASGAITITDDDGAPELSIDDVTVVEGDAGTVGAVFTVTLAAPSGQSIAVNWATADGTATVAGGDYLANSGTLTFAPGGALFQTVTVTVNGDLIDEGAGEAFTVGLSGAVNATISDPSGTGTITDDDDAPTLSIGDVTVTEGDAGPVTAAFVVALTSPSSQTVTVDWATADGSASAGTDYVGGSNTLTFLPGGPLTQQIPITVNGDVLDEGAAEDFTVTLTNPTNAGLGDASATGTITDDDDPPTLVIDDVTITEGNAGQVNAVFTVTQSAASAQTVTVGFATADGTATVADNDYVATSGTLTFTALGPLTRTITVAVNGDGDDEGTAESFTVQLSGATNATIADATGTGTIIDDDGTPTLFMDDVTVLEGDAGTVDAVFTVTKSSASSSTITVDYATADGSATVADGDYLAALGTLTFLPGPAEVQTVTVTVNGDVIDEGVAETFTLNLTNAVNAVILAPSEIGTITDDDSATLSIDDVPVLEGNAGTTDAVFTVTLSTPRSATVSVNYATASGTATAGTDFTDTSGLLTFLPGGGLTQTITVPVLGDLVDEGTSEAFSVVLSGAVNAPISDGTGIGTINDDDDAPTLSVGDVTVTEGNAGTTAAVFTVSLSAPTSQTVGVSWGTANGTATAGPDYVAASGSLTFLPGSPLFQTVSVTVNGDLLDEGASEAFFVSLTGATNATISDPTGVGTITDDDAPPSLTVDDVTVTEGDAGTVNAVFTVTQSAPSGQTVSVDHATADGTATGGLDYVVTTGTLTFAPGGPLTRTVSVVVSGDVLDEGASESFTLQLSNPVNVTLLDAVGAGTITDDDAPPTLSIGNVTVTEGNAGTVSAVFTVSQSAASGLPVTVDWATADGTATVADGDYDADTGSLTFLPGGSLTQTVSVTVNGDVVDEGASEAFTVELSNPGNATIADGTGVGTITDDDGAPTLSIDDVTVTEGNTGTVNAVFTVTRSATSSQPITVDYATADGTASSATDFGAIAGQLTFPVGGPATQTVTVVVNGDLLDEGVSEAFSVNLSNAANAVIADPTGIGTITDDDDPPALSINDVTVVEGNAGTVNAQFTVTLSAASGQLVQVDWAAVPGTAIAGSDYVASAGTLSFGPGTALTRTISVVVSGDLVDEGVSEAFTVQLSNPSNASLVDAVGAGTITDDDDATLSINDVTLQEGNAGTVDAVFTVTKSLASSQNVTVDFATADGTATAGVDYVANAGTLTWLPGGPLTQTVTVVVNGDLIEEGSAETFTVGLTNPVNVAIADATGLGTIVDDEGLPNLFISDVTVVEGDAGTVDAVFTLTQSNASAQPVTVDFATADGSALAGVDYVATSGTLTYNPSDPLTRTVTVQVNGDLIDEGSSEVFTVILSNPTGGVIVDGTGVGTITDDDAATLSIDDVTVTEGDVGTVNAVFTVTKSLASSATVTVDYASADGTATAGSDYTTASGTLSFAPAGPLTQTITVVVAGDLLDEGAGEDFTVGLSNAVNAFIADGSGTGTITDDDDQPSLSVNDVTVTEGSAGTTNAVFTVTLSAASSQPVSVSYATANGTATAGQDYVATSGTLDFLPGGGLTQTVQVPVNGDLLDEGASETFSLNLSSPLHATISDGSGTGTILDDDAPPSLSIDDVTVIEGNAGTVAAVFTVTQSAASGQTVSVDYATADGTASAGTDYTAANGTLTFTPGGPLTRTIAVFVSGDLLDEGTSEAFTVGLSNAANATIQDDSGTGTITDDDGAPALSISDVTVTEGDAGTVAAVFTVTLSAASGQTVGVSYATQDGSASAGVDYVSSAGSLTFLPGGALSQTVTVTVNGDAIDEGSAETFTVQLSGASNASISDATGVGTIIDDDSAPTLSIGDVTVIEGNTGTVNAQFTVTLSAASGLPVSFDFATADGSATAGSDYTATSGTQTFLPNDPLTQLVTVVVQGDLLDEGASETFTVNLSNAQNGAITDPAGLGTITDDDDPPALSIGGVSVVEGNGGTVNAVFTVTQASPSGLTTRTDFQTFDGTATTAGADYVATFGTVTFAPGGPLSQQITVVVNGDLLDEGAAETFTVGLSNPVNAVYGLSTGTGTILDDDAPPSVSIGDVTVSEGNAGTTQAAFTVTMSTVSGLAASVAWATADGTATVADSDYQAGSGTLSFPAGGPLTQQIIVLVNGDLTDESASETFTVNLSAPVNLTIGAGTGTGTIVDDEGPPSLRVDDVTVLEGDAGTVDAVFTVTQSSASSQIVTVDYATADGTATAGADYAAASGTLQFDPGGPLTQQIIVTVSGDIIDEGTSEFFNFLLSNPVNATIVDPSETGTITDDDTAQLTIDDVSVIETNAGTPTAIFTVTKSVPSSQVAVVGYATADQTATAGDDYVATSGTLTFLPGGALTQTISVTVNGDILDEGPSETFTVELSGPINVVIADASGLGTITDDDGPPTISIGDVTVLEGNGGIVQAVFDVTQSAPSGMTTSVNFTTVDGTATAGSDYVAQSGTITFDPMDPLTQQIVVTVNGDVLDEGAFETFTVQLSGVTNAVLGQAVGTGTITDDDDQPTIEIDDVTVTEGNGGTVAATFTVMMSAQSGLPVSVMFATVDGSATVADGDYVAASGTLTFPAESALTQQITITVNGDLRDEGLSESFVLSLFNEVNADIQDDSGTGTITDDDDPPSFSIDDVTVTEGAGGATVDAIFTVTMSAVSGLDVAVDWLTADGTATVAGGDYDTSAGTLSFPAGSPVSQQITITVNGDDLDELDETFSVQLSNPVSASIFDGLGAGLITDDDLPPELSIDDVAVTEGDGGTTTATFTVSMTALSGLDVSVNWQTADGTATVADGDYVVGTGTLNFPAGGLLTQTIDVTVNGDFVDEGASEAYTVALLAPSNATLADGVGAGTITDDDDAGITITPTAGLETNEGGGAIGFAIVLDSEPTDDVTINFSSSDPSEGVPSPTSRVFGVGNWSSPQVVFVLGQNDDFADGDIGYTLVSSPATSTDSFYAGLDAADFSVTNLDDEVAGFTVTEFMGNTVTNEGGQIQAIDVVLDAQPEFDVVITVTSADAGEIVLRPEGGPPPVPGIGEIQLTFTTASWSTQQRVEVRGVSDGVVDGDQTVPITFSVDDASSADPFDPLADTTVFAVNEDQDVPAAGSLTIDNVVLSEGDTGQTTFTFTVTRHGTGPASSVQFMTVDGTATVAGGDYDAASGVLSFPAGGTATETIHVEVNGDTVDEGAFEEFTVLLFDPVNVTISDDTGTGTILDDES